jgi:hypothetical protein
MMRSRLRNRVEKGGKGSDLYSKQMTRDSSTSDRKRNIESIPQRDMGLKRREGKPSVYEGRLNPMRCGQAFM